MIHPKIHAAAVSFCKNPTLVARLENMFPGARINSAGEKLVGDRLIEFLEDADGIIVSTEVISDAIVAKLPKLKILAKYGVGLDSIDLNSLARRGIKLGWTAGVNRRSVSELALGFMLGLSRNIFKSGMQIKADQWNKDGGTQISGKTIGVVGCGNIGGDLVGLLRGFGCQILVHDILDKSVFCRDHNARQVDLETLIRQSDIISLHVPLDHSTHKLVGSDFLSKMRPTAYLINTSRGEVVDQQALKAALIQGKIAGASLDVYEDEPVNDPELTKLSNFWGTPHIGGNAQEAVQAMGNAAIDHLVQFFKSESNT
jgi:phosphoglycerate dehydrogenase-like enzyme